MSSDEELLREWAQGERAAGDAFIRRYFDLLWRYFRNKADADTEDLVQSTLAACVRHRDKLGAAHDVRAYVLMIARNELFAKLRKRQTTPIDPAEISVHELVSSPSTIVARHREHQRLLDALRRLPIELQELLELYYWEGMRAPELAATFAIAEPTVWRRLQRARARLRELLDDDVLRVTDDDGLDAIGRALAPEPE
ncbi:MAG TPA: sigma-70 family RNA polymerase sigma factor [Nannocystaceae bacterium]|nr:sigma-70 family RNA polymerase sigma factor [Nannocystaceae bacterium]